MNNNISCNVVNDLLPLYALGECSEDTKMLVEAHTAECEACRTAVSLFGEESETAIVPFDEKKAISDFSAKLRRRNIIRTLICTVLALAILIGGAVICTVPEFVIAYDDNLVSVDVPVDGGLDIYFTAGNYKKACATYGENEDGTYDVYVTIVNNIFTMLIPDTDHSDNFIRVGNEICVSYNDDGTVQFYGPEDMVISRVYYVEQAPEKFAFLESSELNALSEKHLVWSAAE